ncbi:hypothetical protein ATCC90586_001211 [Pythium insidiosum]|nr:hypothetical protein ATCC90586_001211 [Pythium insidiosum]
MGNCCSSESTATIPHAAAAAEPKATQPLVTATGTATPESGPDGNIDPTAKPDLPVPAEDDFADANGNTIPPVFARVIDSPRSVKKVVQGEHVDLDGPGETQTVQIGNYNLRFSYYSKRGYYPEARKKANQDSFYCETHFAGDDQKAFFAVFDGHGQYGDVCAQYSARQGTAFTRSIGDLVSEELGVIAEPEILCKGAFDGDDPNSPRKETEPAKSEGEVKWIKEIVKGNFLFSHLSEEK